MNQNACNRSRTHYKTISRCTPGPQIRSCVYLSSFRITFVTEGMKKVLASAAERPAGSRGEPVVGLQTAFTGGKTHTMLAIWYMAGVSDPRSRAGTDAVVSESVARAWRSAQRHVLIGTDLGANQRLSRDNESRLYTPWGVMTWRLAGQPGLDPLAGSEMTRATLPDRNVW